MIIVYCWYGWLLMIVGVGEEVTVGVVSFRFGLSLNQQHVPTINVLTAINLTLIIPAFYISVIAPRPKGVELRLLTSRSHCSTWSFLLLGECPRHEAAFITFGRYGINATVLRLDRRERSCVYTVIIVEDIVDNVDGTVDNNGEFDQFSFLFLEFSLEKSDFPVEFGRCWQSNPIFDLVFWQKML